MSSRRRSPAPARRRPEALRRPAQRGVLARLPAGHAEWQEAHRRLDAVGDELLELRLTRKRGALGERLTVMPERSDPHSPAVVVLAPGNRMELAVPRMNFAPRSERILVDG